MSKETILIVEDEQINLLVLKMTMEKNGYTTIQASNGDEALKQIEENHPDLILLDVMMPGKDGFEVCSIVKNNPATRNIQIILLTALNAREDIDKGIEYGVDDFISKPFNEKELLFRVRSLLSIKNLDSFITSQDVFIKNFENMTNKILDDSNKKDTNMELYVTNLIGRVLIPDSSDDRTPEGIYLSLSFEDSIYRGTYFSIVDGEIFKKDRIIPISIESLSSIGILKNHVLVSNWRSKSDNLDDYQTMLPEELLKEAGEVHNFLYYENKTLKILLVNFHNDIQAFDITMFQHLIQLSRTILKILGHMKKSENIYHSLSNSLSKIAEIRNGSEGKHVRVGKICEMLCNSMKCSEVFTFQLQEAIALFDIGNLLVDQSILLKSGPLNDSEMDLVHKAPEFAEIILGSEPRLLAAKEIAAGLYEKWDGSGYPHAKKGEEIPFSARIVSLANTYDSLRSQRNYRIGFTHSEAVKIMSVGDERVKPEHFDPKVLSAFINTETGISKYYDSLIFF